MQLHLPAYYERWRHGDEGDMVVMVESVEVVAWLY